MKTGLGLNFLRIVNEEGSNGWAQVYARVPFDENELMKKGALFGVVFSRVLDDWETKEGEVMTLVDEFFNKQEGFGDLAEVNNLLKDKYGDMEAVWLWVTAGDGKREVRLIKNGNTGVWLWRNNQKVDLGSQMKDEKVLKGLASGQDKLVIWSGDIQQKLSDIDGDINQEEVNKIGNILMDENKSAAGLIFSFEDGDEVLTVERVTEEREKIVTEKITETPVENLDEPMYVGEPEPEEERSVIVSDRYVGPVGPKEKLINWWKKKTAKRNPEILVERKVSKRKRMAAGLGLLFLVLLIVSIVSGSLKIKADNEQKQWNQFSEPIEKKRLEAVGLVNVNLVGSRKLMEEVMTSFNAGKGVFENTKFKGQVTDLEKKINDSWSLASGEKQVKIDNQVSIELIRTGFVGQNLELVKDSSFLVLDGKMGLVVSVDGKTKDIKVLAGKGEGLGWLDTVFDGKRNLLLDQSGISVVGGARIGTFDAAVSKPIAMGVFGSNIYVLDQGNKEIYRYNNASDTLGDRVRWLKQGVNLASTPVDMAIDGDIWVLEDNGNVEHFRRGAQESFTLNGSPSVSHYNKIAIDQNGDTLALLDTTYGAVTTFKKSDGSFIAQLKSDSLKQASDINFDDNGKLWVLIGGSMGTLN
ncbi:MAG TPA: hypothetical protein VF837_01925 [Patescibacteria group bacterium]